MLAGDMAIPTGAPAATHLLEGARMSAGEARCPTWHAIAFAIVGAACAPLLHAQEHAPPPPSDSGFSSWDVQFLYGSQFEEPFNPHYVSKAIVTFENAAGWSWGSSYFFVDVLKSDQDDDNATEVYAEWYPSASLSRLSGTDLGFGPVSDIQATLGINAGTKSNGAHPFVLLPGLTFQLKIPGFAFFSLGTYAYIDRGRFEGTENGCHDTTYQVTPSWSLPFEIGGGKFAFDGFIDFIGSHGQCASQILSQPQLKVDLGSFGGHPDTFYLGVEWQYWHNKFGNEGLIESFPEVLFVWKF
jgi:nucleoside-specific outer membrane channel protein Tsx